MQKARKSVSKAEDMVMAAEQRVRQRQDIIRDTMTELAEREKGQSSAILASFFTYKLLAHGRHSADFLFSLLSMVSCRSCEHSCVWSTELKTTTATMEVLGLNPDLIDVKSNTRPPPLHTHTHVRDPPSALCRAFSRHWLILLTFHHTGEQH